MQELEPSEGNEPRDKLRNLLLQRASRSGSRIARVFHFPTREKFEEWKKNYTQNIKERCERSKKYWKSSGKE